MKRSTTVALRLAALSFLASLGGCSDDRHDITEPEALATEFAALLSDPVNGSRIAAAGLADAAQAASAAGDVAYVSVSPGTIPGGLRIGIRNLETGFTRTEPLVDGGLDPVPVLAAVGDRLEFVATLGGGATLHAVAKVPARRAPRVVRTVPPRGKTDVPLNSRIVVVFSEPIDPATLTAASVRLLRGTEPVGGHVEFIDADRLAAAFVPDVPLAPATGYQLVVSTAIRDRDGESLEAPITIDFTTAAVQPGGAVLVENATTGGAFDITGYQVRYSVAPGAESTASMQLNDSITLSLAPGPQTVELGDVAPNCSVPGGPRRTVNVASDSTSRVTFMVECAAPPELTSVRIVFTRDRVSNSEPERVSHLYVMNGDGGGLRQLTDGPSDDDFPAVSPDGSRIAFTRNWDIHVMNADGTGVRRLTFTGGVGFQPSWSPDGTRIAFGEQGGIFVIGVDGTGLTRLTTPSADQSAILPYADGDPAWSPDGRQIAFWRWEMLEMSVVWIMSADGTGATRLGRRDGDRTWVSWSPIWSPDGRIAFLGPNNSIQPAIFVMDSDGSSATELAVLRRPLRVDDWSADGRWIAFAQHREDSKYAPDIYFLAADGTRMLRITADRRSSSPAFFRGVGF